MRNLPNFLLRLSYPSRAARGPRRDSLENGVVFVSYEGNPDITPIAEHGA